jgi:two-component system, NarL family, response regulator DevR
MAESSVTLLLVDDHNVFCLGLKALFETAAHFTVVGEARTAAEAIAQARRCRPDVILMDVRLSDGNGIEACREIRSERPATKVVMLTSYGDEDAVLASITAGASGYLLKDSDAEQLIEAVKVVARGGSLLDPQVTQTVFERLRRVALQPKDDPLSELSEQERKMLPLVAQGKTNREIATALYLSEHTVKTYLSNILRKLNLSRRAEAAAFIATHQQSAASLTPPSSPVRR